MTTQSEREALLRPQLAGRPLETGIVTVHVPNLGPEKFHRHTNYDGTPGGWVQEYAQVAHGVIVPATAIVDAHATIKGQGRLDEGAYIGMRSWVDFTRDVARVISA